MIAGCMSMPFRRARTAGSVSCASFTNIHPGGVGRLWRVGEPFEVVARPLLAARQTVFPRLAGEAAAACCGVTKSLRSEYDHLMLQLHDGMKSSLDYQQDAQQVTGAICRGKHLGLFLRPDLACGDVQANIYWSKPCTCRRELPDIDPAAVEDQDARALGDHGLASTSWSARRGCSGT